MRRMQEEKSWVYTLILGVCMLLCLLLLGRMLLGHAEQRAGDAGNQDTEQGETQMGIPITDETLCTLLAQALPVQTTQLTAHIGADQTITVSAAVKRQVLEDSGLVPGSLRTALLFLPDPCSISVCWTVALADGALALQCREATLADIALPEELTAPLSEQLAAALNRALAQSKLLPAGLQWEDGRLTLLP